MINLTIDGKVEESGLESESTFGEYLEKLSQRISNRGKVITGIRMNNQSLTEGKQYDFKNFPIDSIETIELDTADPVKLAREALDSSESHIEMLKTNSMRTAELFRLGDEIEANEYYSRLVEGLRWLVRGFSAMAGMLGIEEDENFLEDRSVNYYQNQILIPVFDKMYDAQKREDWVELADALEYELIPALDEWDSLLKTFRKKIDGDLSNIQNEG